MGTKITFKRPDGKDAAGYLAKAGRANAPLSQPASAGKPVKAGSSGKLPRWST